MANIVCKQAQRHVGAVVNVAVVQFPLGWVHLFLLEDQVRLVFVFPLLPRKRQGFWITWGQEETLQLPLEVLLVLIFVFCVRNCASICV